MDRRDFLRLGGIATVGAFLQPDGAAALSAYQGAQADGWIPLFNGRNLDGWYSMLSTSGRGVAETRGYLSVENGMIHILGNPPKDGPVETGYFATNQEYENYRVRVEYKWGTSRFPPRLEAKRDNGLIYHVVGPDAVWPTCAECQIQETDTGDAWMLTGARAARSRNLFDLPETVVPGAPAPPPRPGATPPAPLVPVTGRIFKEGDFEKVEDWNVVEVVTRGDRSLHIVNGRINNALSMIQRPDPQNPGQFIPLTRGKIALQIEYAEMWVRRVEIRPGG
jgi:hypothetical protein